MCNVFVEKSCKRTVLEKRTMKCAYILNGIRCISQHIYCYMKLWSYDESVHGKFVISTSRLLSRASLNAETDWQVTWGDAP